MYGYLWIFNAYTMDILVIDDTLDGAFFCLPASSMTNQGKPVFLPDFDNNFRIYPGIAARICRMGKNVASRYASRYFVEVAPAFSVRSIGTIDVLRGKGLPLAQALCFDGSLVTGTFRSLDGFTGFETLSLITRYDRVSMEEALKMASTYRTMRIGDLVVWIPKSEGLIAERGIEIKASWVAPDDGEAARFKVK